MEINKQLFEDVLSGKLKGTFVLRANNTKVNSSILTRNNSFYSGTHPYRLFSATYNPNGKVSLYDYEGLDDIIDFIPDTNMKENELKIEIPEGYEIDKKKSTFEKIVFKKKENIKPRSWEEYCRQQKIKGAKGYLIDTPCANICECYWSPYNPLSPLTWRNTLPSEELAEAFLAMMQLMSLRQAWIGDWKPNWKTDIRKWCIIYCNCELYVDFFICTVVPLSFPTKEMAEDFMNTFKDLLNVARPLI